MMMPSIGKKFRRTAIASYFEADRHLRDLGLRAANQEYVKFIILGRGRTGSTMLRSALNQHSEIVMYGEVFRGRPRWDTRFGLRRQQFGQMIIDDPQSFADEIIFRNYPSQTKAVGFKIFYAHAHEGARENLWSYLRDDKSLRVVHLRRRNILETYLSSRLARRSGHWNVKVDSDSSQPAAGRDDEIYLDYEECLQFFTQTRSDEEQFNEYFTGHPILDLWYKDLVRDYPEEIQRVQNYLDLQSEPIQPLTRKKKKRPLAEQIANYDDLKQSFANSEWSGFFVE